MIGKINLFIRHFANDSLYRNSIYLMLSTAVMAFFGFFFWIINARLYTPEEVGIATTIISVMTLISGISSLGLNIGIVRFLPKIENKNEIINSCFAISILVSICSSIIFIFGLQFFSPKLLFLTDHLFYQVSFILFVTALTINTLVESIFTALRSAKFTVYKNIVLSIAKLVLPLFFVTMSAYGIFTAIGVANLLAFGLSIVILIQIFNYTPRITLNLDVVRKIGSYSFGNYVAGFLNSLPQILLPIIITNKIGAQESAYYYISMMIANLLFIIPQATTSSLFAEGSHDEDKMGDYIHKSVKITALILFPTIMVTVLLGNYILLAFGKQYSQEAFTFLQLLAWSSILVFINSIFVTILRVRNKIGLLIGVNIFNLLTVLLLSYIFIEMKLFGIGIAWVISLSSTALIYSIFIIRKR